MGVHHLLLALVLVFPFVRTAKIVFFEPMGTLSHKNAFMPLALELLQRGHDVSFVTFRSDKRFTAAGGKEVVLKQLELDKIMEALGVNHNFFEERLRGVFRQKVHQISVMDRMFEKVAEKTYGDENLADFVKNQTVDLVVLSVFFADGYLPLIKQWDCPYILISPGGIFPSFLDRFGQPDEYSSYPVLITPFSGQMTFFERVMNVLAGEYMKAMMTGKWAGYGEKHSRVLNITLPAGGMNELIKNASMLFLNNYHSVNFVKAYPPTIIEVGGMHCGPAKPIPVDLEEFVSGSGEHGFIVFGLGSAIKVSDMSVEFQKMFLNAFARLKQRVIWKWETSAFDSVPENVKLVKWLPQQDLLGHPKIRAVLSHGGLLSVQEAVYHGVPIVGLPLGFDQDLNIGKVVRDGYGLLIDWNDLSEEIIYTTIQEIVTKESFKERAQYYSQLVKDQPQTPLERATFWVEYVIRHRGAPHLQSTAKDLTRLQRNLVDVIVFLAAIALAILIVTFLAVRALFRFALRKLLGAKPSEKATRDKKRN